MPARASQQTHEPPLRMAIGGIRTAQGYLRGMSDPQSWDESNLLDALAAMDHAIWNIRQWASRNDIQIREQMNT